MVGGCTAKRAVRVAPFVLERTISYRYIQYSMVGLTYVSCHRPEMYTGTGSLEYPYFSFPTGSWIQCGTDIMYTPISK